MAQAHIHHTSHITNQIKSNDTDDILHKHTKTIASPSIISNSNNWLKRDSFPHIYIYIYIIIIVNWIDADS